MYVDVGLCCQNRGRVAKRREGAFEVIAFCSGNPRSGLLVVHAVTLRQVGLTTIVRLFREIEIDDSGSLKHAKIFVVVQSSSPPQCREILNCYDYNYKLTYTHIHPHTYAHMHKYIYTYKCICIYYSALIAASVPGLSFMPFSRVLNRCMRYDSRCSRSRFDLNPVSKSVTDNLSKEWPGRLRCFDRGRFGADFAWAL